MEFLSVDPSGTFMVLALCGGISPNRCCTWLVCVFSYPDGTTVLKLNLSPLRSCIYLNIPLDWRCHSACVSTRTISGQAVTRPELALVPRFQRGEAGYFGACLPINITAEGLYLLQNNRRGTRQRSGSIKQHPPSALFGS